MVESPVENEVVLLYVLGEVNLGLVFANNDRLGVWDADDVRLVSLDFFSSQGPLADQDFDFGDVGLFEDHGR